MKKKYDSFLDFARKEVLKERKEKAIYGTLIIIFVLSSVYLTSIFLIQYLYPTGYASYVYSQAGEITELHITYKKQTSNWAGIYGLALRVPDFTETLSKEMKGGDLERMDLFFDCLQHDAPGGPLIFASTSQNLDFNNVQAATHEMVNEFMSCSEEDVFCSEHTFGLTKNFTVGTQVIENVLSTFTYKYDGDHEVFDIGILNISGELAFVTHLSSEIQKGYSPEVTINYQMLLPTPKNDSARYYFFSDPHDICPEGGIGETLEARVSGYVEDFQGNPVENASVVVAGYSTKSESDGFYNLTFLSIPGEHNFVARKDGYGIFVDTIEVNFTSFIIEKNATLPEERTGVDILPFVQGWVFDDRGDPLNGVTVYLGNSSTVSDSSGYYSMNTSVLVGENPIVAFRQDYENYYDIIDFEFGDTFLEHNITMLLVNPYATGPYEEEPEDIEDIIEEGEDHLIIPDEIKKQIRQNTFMRDSLTIYNFRPGNMNLFFSLTGDAANLIRLADETLQISPGGSEILEYTIYATEPVGIYTGILEISGDLDIEIPIRIEIVDRRMPIETLLIDLDILRETIRPDEDLRFRVNLQNLLTDQSYKVILEHRILDMNNTEMYVSEMEEVEIFSSITLLKSFIFEENLPEGDYILQTNARYSNAFSTAIAPFSVVQPIHLYSFFGIPLWVILLGIVSLSFISINLFAYKRHLDKKKRYKISRDLSKLPKDSERSLKIGKIAETNVNAFYNMDDLTTHMVVAGATGGGKSISAQVFVEEALKKNIAVVVFDPTAQWSGMLRKCDDKGMLAHYSKFGLKPTDAKAFPGTVKPVKNARQAIDITKYIQPGKINIFSLNKLDPSEMDVFVSSAIISIFRSGPDEHPGLRTIFVFDEVHRLLPKFGGSGKGFLQIERACREFRKWGFGMLLVSQVLSDFVGEIKANINTEVQMRIAAENDLARVKERYGEEVIKSLVRSDVGTGMIQNAEYNHGKPYFVSFRPILHNTRRLSDEELDKYHEYGEIVEDLEYQIEQLKGEKVDVFDLNMELKLVNDKLMTGNFNVVDIYLEGLKPRIEKEWEKLGKKPKKRKVELIGEEEVEKSLKEAEKERKKWEEEKEEEESESEENSEETTKEE